MTRIATLIALGGLAATFAAPLGAQSFEYAVRARSTLATGGQATSVDDATHFDGSTSATAHDSFTDAASGRDFALDASASLASGALRVRNRGEGGPGASQSNTATFLFSELFDTFTFRGDYTSTPLRLPFTATYDGNWDAADLFGSTQIFAWLWFADDSLDYTQQDFLDTATLFFDPGRLRGDLTQPSVPDNGTQAIHVVYQDVLELTGVDPVLHAWMGLEADVNNFSATGRWDADLSHTATLIFDFAGLDVRSASGVFPGAQAATLPEPGAGWLVVAAALLAWRVRRPVASRAIART